jgi:periplasmic divalent cation tolerance protein
VTAEQPDQRLPPDALLVCTTVEAGERAASLARSLVENRLAACVHVMPPGESVYRWQGNIECAQEHTLLIKTTAAGYAALESWLRAHHPYQIPEILALPITQGLPDYLNWIRECTR